MENVDSLIHGRWIVPVRPKGQILENHTLVIEGSRIKDIIPTHEVVGRYQSAQESHLTEHLLIPGFINSHTHAAMSLLRGVADDLPLEEWLNDHIWPLEQKLVDEAFVRDGSELAICEMIRSGTTCFADMYFYPEATAEVANKAGIRAKLGIVISDSETSYAKGEDDYFNKGLALADSYKHHPLISCQFAPHATYTVSDAPLQRAMMLSTELSIPIQMHIHETKSEVETAVESTGMRPLKRLEELGLLTPDLQAVHMTQLLPEEITTLADNSVHVVHCPESNLKLSSGTCPVDDLIAAGVNVALGTDGAASNNDLDMLGEMHTAALLSNASAEVVLEMATINGAKALAMEEQIGSLEIGKQADFIAVDMSAIEQLPIFNPISQLVYTSNRNQITDLWVAGKHLMKNRQLSTMNLKSIVEQTKQWQVKIQKQDNNQ